eukprot:TRINITY_DN277_c0_g5_i2.p2 TRINITY_DN277_c0_g5~~TRINITY_DN277_c0_g5_i2.p2  ORF type:complete len:720 (-),score=192.46 TRINITY_DN277_c0_g5_i2:527-2476(-)
MSELIGTHASIEMQTELGPRFFDGIVVGVTNVGNASQGPSENRRVYNLVLMPWIWLAGTRRNQRIFHEKSAVEIVKEVFSAYSGLGSPHLDDSNLSGSYSPLEYTVQYRETDLDFCTRIMQAHGISYYFTFAEGSHTLKLTDDAQNHDPIPGDSRVFLPHDAEKVFEDEHFWEWKPSRNFTTGAIRLTDYNFKVPGQTMEVDKVGDAEYSEGQIESFDFPGAYLDEGSGKKVVATRVDQERIRDRRHHAVGDVMTLAAGHKIELVGDHLPKLETYAFVCMRANHSYTSQNYHSGASGDTSTYQGTYEFIPDDVPLVPENKAPQPVAHGVQTATVVGEGEIDCDEHGRILVKFHWDLETAHSMRCRVSQNWAHKGYGGMVIPRIGMEVIVEFIEGDPSKPIVTGCVFNGKNTPPYPLPANKTRSVFKTDSHEAEGFNELRFEDKGGEEEIWIHSQKDRNEKTLNDHSEEIDHDWSQLVGNDKAIEVVHDHTEKIGNDETRETGNNQKVTVGQNHTEDIGKDRTETVGQNNKTTIGKDHTHTVAKNNKQSTGENETVTVGKNATEKVGKNKTISVGDNLTITAGKAITITCGKASISIKKDGTIAISGQKMSMEGDTMKLDTKKGTTVKAQSLNTKTSGKTVMKGSKIDMN